MDERLAELDRLGEAATKGEWTRGEVRTQSIYGPPLYEGRPDLKTFIAAVAHWDGELEPKTIEDERNLEFIVAAANACRPGGWLVAEVRWLRMEQDEDRQVYGRQEMELEAELTRLRDRLAFMEEQEQRTKKALMLRCKENDQLGDQLAAMRAGLEPFAKYDNYRGSEMPDTTQLDPYIERPNLGDCRRAAELLAEPKEVEK